MKSKKRYRIVNKPTHDLWGELWTNSHLQEHRWWGWKTIKIFDWLVDIINYCETHYIKPESINGAKAK